jgi:hypothetical protein
MAMQDAVRRRLGKNPAGLDASQARGMNRGLGQQISAAAQGGMTGPDLSGFVHSLQDQRLPVGGGQPDQGPSIMPIAQPGPVSSPVNPAPGNGANMAGGLPAGNMPPGVMGTPAEGTIQGLLEKLFGRGRQV